MTLERTCDMCSECARTWLLRPGCDVGEQILTVYPVGELTHESPFVALPPLPPPTTHTPHTSMALGRGCSLRVACR